MNEELRALLTAILVAPDDLKPLTLVEWLDGRDAPRAGLVRKHCETGSIYLPSYTLTGDGTGHSPSVTLLALQLLPQPLAVEFGCRCADHVLPVFHQEWPNDSRPEQLITATRDWLMNKQTKARVTQLAFGMAELVDEQAAEPVAGIVRDVARELQRYRAACAARSVVCAAGAVKFTATSGRWVSEICQGVMEALSASVEAGATTNLRERSWQRQELARLLNSCSDLPSAKAGNNEDRR